MNKTAVHIWLEGYVQGVGYRHHTSLKAAELGVKGWVKNIPNYRVEAWFEGTEEQLDLMLDWCWNEGSPDCRVKGMSQQPEEPQNFEDFQILP